MKISTVLVTGATGFIGKNLVPHLLKRGYNVHVMVRHERKEFGESVVYHQTPTVPEWETLMGNIDAVIHLAGVIDINSSLEEPRKRIEGNSDLLFPILEASRTTGRTPLVVYTSTDRVYGRTNKRIVTEDEPPFPIEPYTAAKIIGEVILQTYQALYNIPFVILRLDSVYGPGQPRSMFISDVIQKLQSSPEIETGPLSAKKNFVYVDDVVLAIEKCLRAPKTAHNRIYNIGSQSASLKSILEIIIKIISTQRGIKQSSKVKKMALRPSKIEVRPFALSTRKAQKYLKWQPKTDLYNGLIKTIEYFNTYENKS